MIIRAVQDDYIELRISLTDSQSGEMVALNSGDKLEFVSNVRTTEYEEDTDGKNGKTQIRIQSDTTDLDGKIMIKLNFADYHVIPGVYRWEINAVRADGTKTCLLARENNELIIREREAVFDD